MLLMKDSKSSACLLCDKEGLHSWCCSCAHTTISNIVHVDQCAKPVQLFKLKSIAATNNTLISV